MAKNVSDAYVRESINAQLDELAAIGCEEASYNMATPSGCSRKRFLLLFWDVLTERREKKAGA
jgi:hypothetical protein